MKIVFEFVERKPELTNLPLQHEDCIAFRVESINHFDAVHLGIDNAVIDELFEKEIYDGSLTQKLVNELPSCSFSRSFYYIPARYAAQFFQTLKKLKDEHPALIISRRMHARLLTALLRNRYILNIFNQLKENEKNIARISLAESIDAAEISKSANDALNIARTFLRGPLNFPYEGLEAATHVLQWINKAVQWDNELDVAQLVATEFRAAARIIFSEFSEFFDETYLSLRKALFEADIITELNLSDKDLARCLISSSLQPFLENSRYLKKLDISFQIKPPVKIVGSLGPQQAGLIAQVLMKNQGLEELSLAGQPLLDEGIEAICDALIQNSQTKLRVLDVSRCGLTESGVSRLIETVYRVTSLEVVKISAHHQTLEPILNALLSANQQKNKKVKRAEEVADTSEGKSKIRRIAMVGSK